MNIFVNLKKLNFLNLLKFFLENYFLEFKVYLTENPRNMLLEFKLKRMKHRFPGQLKEEPNEILSEKR